MTRPNPWSQCADILAPALLPTCLFLLWMRPAGPTARTRGGLTIPPAAGEAAIGAPGQDPSSIVARPVPIKMQLITDHLAAQGTEPKTKAVATTDLVTLALEDKLDGDWPRAVIICAYGNSPVCCGHESLLI